MSSVRRSLATLLALGAVLITLVGLVGGISSFQAARAFDHMVDDIRPAAVASRGMHEEALAAGAAIRAFALSSDREELGRFRQSLRGFEKHYDELSTMLPDDDRIASLRERANTTFAAWVAGYAEPRIATGGGTDTYSARLYRTGQQQFAESERAQVALVEAIEDEYSAIRAQVHDQSRATVTLIALTTVIGVVMLAVFGRWLVASIQNPLGALGRVVRRLRDGEQDARAAVFGPDEVREVATAVNELAVENGRARDVEVKIQRDLRQMDRMRTEFVSNVSHELRTPLTIISGNLELLEDDLDGQASEDQVRMLAGARRNVTRLADLIEDLLTLNSAENSGTALDLVDFQAVVKEVVIDMGIAASGRGCTLEHRRTREPIVVLGDPDQLRRVVMNLVRNALKFSAEGGVVSLEVTRDDPDVRLVVQDQGMGIPAEDLDKVGSRFFRAQNAVSGEIAGTGLGLRIVQTIVANHHGSMSIASVLGEGTTVTVVLPLAREQAGPETG
jgi:signal transduction histidine kinase